MKEDYPRNLVELEARFSTEEACREYLLKLRWPEGFVCPRCGIQSSMGQQTQSAALRRLRLPGLGDGGHDFPGHPQALDVVVPGGLVGDNAKRRGQRAGVAAGLGFG